MANFLSSTSEPCSSLQPPDGGGVKAEERPRMEREELPLDLAKRFYELQALNDRIKEESQRLGALNLVLEEKFRQQRRLLEDKEELIIRLKEDAMSMSGTEGRLKEKYDRLNDKYQNLREAFELEEMKWKEGAKNSEEKCWLLEVEKRKLQIDLQAARKGADGSGGDAVEKMKAVEELKRLLEEKEAAISELVRKNEVLEKEKMKNEEELGGRVVKLEQAVAKWIVGKAEKSTSAAAGMACKGKGMGDLQNSGPKSAGASLIQPKKETIEADVQVNGHDRKKLGSMVPGIGKEVKYAPKSAASIVQISDDEEEEEEKQIHRVAPSTAKWPLKRKLDAITCSPEKQAKTRLCKSNAPQEGKLWETSKKMFNALSNSNLCIKSICALYRKHKSLGVWKNGSNECKVFLPLCRRGMYLGQLFTGGDPEGRMKKTVADWERDYSDDIIQCREIVRLHVDELFEIYDKNMDPLFQP